MFRPLDNQAPVPLVIMTGGPESALPAAEAVTAAVRSTIFYAGMLGVVALVARALRGWVKIPAGLLAVCALLSTDIRTPG